VAGRPNSEDDMSPTLTLKRLRSGVDVIDAIYDRRAVRAYTQQKVEEDVVRRLINAAIHAPSAVNAQPWAFCVVQDPALLREISDRAKDLSLERIQPGTPLWEHRSMLQEPAFNVFYDGGTLIVVCAAPGAWPTNEDCCLAAQNLMLAAHGLGLGTCPIGFAREALNEPAAKRELGIPEDHSVVLPILVGYPRERPARIPRRPARILSWRG
jgi:nitroreductase